MTDLVFKSRHSIMCGDCTVWENIKGLMGNEIPEVLYTDPPYGIDLNFDEVYSKSSGNGLADRNVYKKIKNDSDLSQIAGIVPFINIFEKKVIWGCNYFAYLLPPSKCWLSWFKKEDLPADTFCDTELAWTDLKKHTKTFSVNWRGMIKEGETGQKRVHPNQKPILLAEQIFEYMEAEKNIVDLFLGSGSTLIACEKTNRKCFGMEISEHYTDIVVKRFADFTHQSDNIYLERDGEKIPYASLIDLNPIL